MNDSRGLADQIGKPGIADDTFAAHQAHGHRRWVELIMQRWPTASALRSRL
jgi:hypothetical protein